jgi:hypothetical protein
MQRIFAAVLAIVCVVGSTPVLARGAAHGFGGGYARATTRLAPPTPQAPMDSRIPAPLASPSSAPTIYGWPLGR